MKHDLCVVLTGAGAVVHGALLRVAPQPALEAVLPELWEPGIPQVGIGLQVQVIIIEPGHICRLKLYSDSTSCLLLVAISHIVPVSPTITGKEEKGRARQGNSRLLVRVRIDPKKKTFLNF